MPHLTALQHEPTEGWDAQFAAALRPVLVQPSLLLEIGWVLWRLERAYKLDDQSPLGAAVDAPRRLIVRAGAFWDDGIAGFSELGVLAHRAGVLFEPRLDLITSGLSAVELGEDPVGLASERPDERMALARRLDWICRDAKRRAEYVSLVGEIGAWVVAGMGVRGHRVVELECVRVRGHLAQGLPLSKVVPPDALSSLGLEPLVTAALASGQLIVSPCFYAGSGHVADLGEVVSFGYGVTASALRSATVARGGQIALKAGLLAELGTRVHPHLLVGTVRVVGAVDLSTRAREPMSDHEVGTGSTASNPEPYRYGRDGTCRPVRSISSSLRLCRCLAQRHQR